MPIFFFLVTYAIAEIYVLAKVWSAFGFVNMFFALLASAVLGAGIIKNQGRFLLRNLQDALSRGQVPSQKILSGVMIFIGGVLLLMPGFVSDFLGLLLILPGTRHAIVAYLRYSLAKKLTRGAFNIFTAGSGGPFGGFGGFRTGSATGAGPRPSANPGARPGARPAPPDEGWARDVSPKVIDIKPASSKHHTKQDPKKPNSD